MAPPVPVGRAGPPGAVMSGDDCLKVVAYAADEADLASWPWPHLSVEVHDRRG
ncbi:MULTISPECIES: hypothetical protein [unclassified Nonomuraea]|uniref:hypothetical protein n=1 Tax=unclassified Nonomuraea TaxID=2593643 RepID=UPI003403558B